MTGHTTATVIKETGKKVSGQRKDRKKTWWWKCEVQEVIQKKRKINEKK